MRLCYAIVLVGCAIFAAGCKESEPAAKAASIETDSAVYFAVDGMMCEESCAAAVKGIIAAQPGVWDTNVNFEEKTARCVVDEEKFDADTVIAELDDKGFQAKLKGG